MELLKIFTTTQMVTLYVTFIVAFIIIRHFKEALIKIMGRPATVKTANMEASINQSPSIERSLESINDIEMLKDKLRESGDLKASARQDAEQRNLIEVALISNGLVEYENPIYKITDHGKEYRKDRNIPPLPPAPTPPTTSALSS